MSRKLAIKEDELIRTPQNKEFATTSLDVTDPAPIHPCYPMLHTNQRIHKLHSSPWLHNPSHNSFEDST